MTTEEWRTDKPPNETWVEAWDEETGEVHVVLAFYGRDGYRPHWKGQDGSLWASHAFSKWRPLPEKTRWDYIQEA